MEAPKDAGVQLYFLERLFLTRLFLGGWERGRETTYFGHPATMQPPELCWVLGVHWDSQEFIPTVLSQKCSQSLVVKLCSSGMKYVALNAPYTTSGLTRKTPTVWLCMCAHVCACVCMNVFVFTRAGV